MTHLRKMMLEELQRRNYSQTTVRAYLLAVRQFAEYFHRPPDQLGPDHIRRFQSYLLQEKKLSQRTVVQRVSALRFLFVKTLRRHHMLEHIPFPKAVRRLPIVLSQEEVGRLIDSASNLLHRTMLMTLYSTGIRRAELCRLQVRDIDSQRRLVSHSRRQGWPRSRRAAQPQTAGDATGILALEEAEDLPVPWYGKELARGRPDQ